MKFVSTSVSMCEIKDEFLKKPKLLATQLYFHHLRVYFNINHEKIVNMGPRL